MNTLAQELLKQNAVANWTEEEFEVIERKILGRIVVANGAATVGLPQEIQEKIMKKGLNEADKALAFQVMNSTRRKNVAHVRPETHLNTCGGTFFSDPKETTYFALNGKTEKRPNAAIPAHFDEVEKRPNVQAVAALSAQLVKHEAGVWKSSMNASSWNKVFGGSAVSVAGMMKVAGMTAQILNQDKAWTTMSSITKNAITSIELLSFVRAALDRCDIDCYDLLNTTIVFEGLALYEKVGQDYFPLQNADGQPLVPDHVYKEMPCSTKSQDILMEAGYPGCYWYQGGLSVAVFFQPLDGTLKSAILAGAKMREIQGSDSSPCALLAGMRNYGGLNDDFGKQCQFMVASVLAVWQRNQRADVWVNSVGDVPLMVSSLNKWKREITTKQIPGFGQRQVVSTAQDALPKWESVACDFKLILPKQMDLNKVQANLRDYTAVIPRPGAVAVIFSQTGLPTASVKAAVVDYDEESQRILPEQVVSGDYIAYCPIYGTTPFSSDEHVIHRESTGHVKTKFWVKDPFVYKWSNASGFRGVLSTFDRLNLIGWGHPMRGDPQKKEWDATVTQFIPIPLERVSTQKEWYNVVINDAGVQAVTFLKPVSRYSPITNLCMLSQKGVVYSKMMLNADEGVIIPNQAEVANRPGLATRAAVKSSWGKKQDQPQPLGATTASETRVVNSQADSRSSLSSGLRALSSSSDQGKRETQRPSLAAQMLGVQPQPESPPLSVEEMENDPTLGSAPESQVRVQFNADDD